VNRILKIEAEGNFSNATDYFKYLVQCENFPATLNGYVTLDYFCGESFFGNRKNGRNHGQGTYTYSNGDTFEGNFVANRRQGHGKMTFQSGDVYEGDWKTGAMDGQGKYVYAKTGNTYIGGFKTGRKHGKGVMHYNQADEEQSLCQICYDNEIDALFYDCGHVCSCMECGKQLENCPVCRRKVLVTVKMWRA